MANARYCSACGYELPKPANETAPLPSPSSATKRSPESRKKLIGAISGIIGACIGSVVMQKVFFAPPSFDKQLMAAASELNKTCPIMADQYTRLDNAVALPDNVFQYNYTIVTNDKSEINTDTVKKYMEPGIINNIRTSPSLKFFREHKTTLVYSYRDKNGAFAWKITVTPDMYQ